MHNPLNELFFLFFSIYEWEKQFVKDFARYYKANRIIDYCLPFTFDLTNPSQDTYEWLVLQGIAHFAGYYYTMTDSVPFHFVYSLTTYKDFLFSRHPVKLSIWANIGNLFQPLVWLLTLISMIALGFSFLITVKFYNHFLAHANLATGNDDIVEFFLLTFACITEPNPLPWFTRKAVTGRLLISVWMASALILNLSFNSNYRATLLKPRTEKPIDSLQDAFDRGENIWTVHLSMPDGSIDRHYLYDLANPAIKDYIVANGLTTFLPSEDTYISSEVIKDIMDNGASLAAPVSVSIPCKEQSMQVMMALTHRNLMNLCT